LLIRLGGTSTFEEENQQNDAQGKIKYKYSFFFSMEFNFSYDMLSNCDLGMIPMGSLLSPGALVAVWCTNSPSNIKDLKETILPSWGLDYVATWYWVKVDNSGSTVVKFLLSLCIIIINFVGLQVLKASGKATV
jgi:N6-adenosine-specific RNA methylase IME4